MVGQPLEEIGRQADVGVEHDHDLAGGLPDADIAGLTTAAASRMDQAHPPIGIAPDDLRGPIGGIVDDNDLLVVIIEAQEGFQGGDDITGLIVRRDDNAEFHLSPITVRLCLIMARKLFMAGAVPFFQKLLMKALIEG